MNLYDVYSLFDITPVKGKGSYIYDFKGREYLDFYGGHAVISIGHSHPHYVHKISAQLQELGFYSNSVINPLQQVLAGLLEITSGLKGYELFLINSGAEANENALKLASFYNNRTKVLALENCFHGRTSAAINVTNTASKHQAPINHGIDVTYVHFEDEKKMIDEIRSHQYAAIIIEVIQGVGGLDMISADLLDKIQIECEKSKTILIMDEIQCGYGRSGNFFAFQESSIRPDIITMAKGMGNGFPIGGILINARKMPPVKSQLGTTFGGNHLACAAGIAVLEVMQMEDLVENARAMGNRIKQLLHGLPLISKIKGQGLMLGAELEINAKIVREKLIYDHHVFTGSSHNPKIIRILPPLNITDKEVDIFVNKLETTLRSIS